MRILPLPPLHLLGRVRASRRRQLLHPLLPRTMTTMTTFLPRPLLRRRKHEAAAAVQRKTVLLQIRLILQEQVETTTMTIFLEPHHPQLSLAAGVGVLRRRGQQTVGNQVV